MDGPHFKIKRFLWLISVAPYHCNHGALICVCFLGRAAVDSKYRSYACVHEATLMSALKNARIRGTN